MVMVLLLIVLAVLVLIFLPLIILLLSQVKVEISFTYKGHHPNLLIKVVLWRIIKFRRNIPLIELNPDTMTINILEKDDYFGSQKEKNKSFKFEDIQQQWKLMNGVIKTTKDVIPHIKRALKAVQLHQLSWHTLVGVNRADHTAILTGVLYSLKGGVASMAMNYLTPIGTPIYSIQPHYTNSTYQTELECILSFKLGQIMRELLSIARQYGKLKKVGIK
ncbi:DUF2953 domain-containing protein [Piscibacillus halophilus]|uniref:DUF2953 domain-containing protein n=1 Tax=Piscibacillus halophilus TaxID=571933 RepID=A0A1H9MG46_9BACI|nr:DUF2953 domain-containing protein [Piscibacillus halophilus]SER22696.1 Protein of unknown function [Piscibacillus halophilus]